MAFWMLSEEQAGGPIPKKIYDLYTWFDIVMMFSDRDGIHDQTVKMVRRLPNPTNQLARQWRRDVDQPVRLLQ
jgi:hypothetical protein